MPPHLDHDTLAGFVIALLLWLVFPFIVPYRGRISDDRLLSLRNFLKSEYAFCTFFYIFFYQCLG